MKPTCAETVRTCLTEDGGKGMTLPQIAASIGFAIPTIRIVLQNGRHEGLYDYDSKKGWSAL